MSEYAVEGVKVNLNQFKKNWSIFESAEEIIFVSNETQKVDYRLPKEGPFAFLGEMPVILSSLIRQIEEKEKQLSNAYANSLISEMGEPEIQNTADDFFDIYFSVRLSRTVENDARLSEFPLTPDAQSVWASFYEKGNNILFDLCDEGEGRGYFPFTESEIEMMLIHIKSSGILEKVDASRYPHVNFFLNDTVSA